MLENILRSIPPITRINLLLSFALCLLVTVDKISPYDTYFSLSKTLEGQIWRPLTSLFVAKRIDPILAFQLFFLFHVSSSIELSGFRRGSVDYLFFIALASAAIFLFAAILQITYLAIIFKHVLYYYYGRINSEHLILLNMMPVRAPYLIWVIFLLEWIVETPDLKSLAISIFIGHTLYFALNVYPRLRFNLCKDFFDTPAFLYVLNVRLVSPLFPQENLIQQQDVGGLF